MPASTLIIGGGAAGFFSAIHRAANYPDEQITILERGKSVLGKVRISGGGRCNVTHACWDPRELVKFYPRGAKELLGPFNTFACGDTMGWFSDRGVELKIEDDGRIFPVSDSSQSIIDCLWNTAKGAGVKVLTKTRVTGIIAPSTTPEPAAGPRQWTVKSGERTFLADRLIVTSGSNPAVWKMLAELGHTIVPAVPSLFAFDTKDTRLRDLSGISVPWAQLNIKGDKLKAEGPLLITHRGLSGPAVLRLSAWGARLLAPRKYNFELTVNWLAMRATDVEDQLDELKAAEAKRQIGTRACFDLSARLWKSLVNAAGIPADQQWSQLSKRQRTALTEQLTNGRFHITGKSTNKDEFTTAGGVDLREVDFKSFRSKVHPTLHLAGEVLDIDAITGGFNFQAAWTGGVMIGKAGK
ncbi:NAD(P)/FAD-dependent oxidoreductase [Neolewinella aurantiaca]|uniref:NAD(P)/FAD-dependent oxidoreductase n=1 Tax=Neolewinella aurantiaca TaxID=2602767 RepID=A0A5C7FJM1_9BACT|nr:NAD(P)/FAD-dependent oxidoreductase [Neolewinella aurantiaca]TXF91495.1 NAD(P)/FAD-dependent oxidoreductase [Neolewinella aurantiaca]